MNKDNAKEYLPLVQALAEGKIIQTEYDGVWTDNLAPTFSVKVERYRIKPEPIKKWYRVAQFGNGVLVVENTMAEGTIEINKNFIKWLTPRVEYIVEE